MREKEVLVVYKAKQTRPNGETYWSEVFTQVKTILDMNSTLHIFHHETEEHIEWDIIERVGIYE